MEPILLGAIEAVTITSIQTQMMCKHPPQHGIAMTPMPAAALTAAVRTGERGIQPALFGDTGKPKGFIMIPPPACRSVEWEMHRLRAGHILRGVRGVIEASARIAKVLAGVEADGALGELS